MSRSRKMRRAMMRAYSKELRKAGVPKSQAASVAREVFIAQPAAAPQAPQVVSPQARGLERRPSGLVVPRH